jgi:hypothetical protein
MKYKVIFHTQAILDIETSFEWGGTQLGQKTSGKMGAAIL